MTLTIEDIRNPARKSGFDHVTMSTPSVNGHDLGPNHNPYFARKYGGKLDRAGRSWLGPRRATAEEAAQDYCDYMNSGSAATPTKPALKSAGHNARRSRLPDDPEVQAALGVLRDAKGQAAGKQGYVYCIWEYKPGGGMEYVKIGFSTNPHARVAELQCGNPRKLVLHALKKGTLEDEAELHQRYIARNVLQEWFRPTKELLLEFDLDPATMKPWASVR